MLNDTLQAVTIAIRELSSLALNNFETRMIYLFSGSREKPFYSSDADWTVQIG